MELVGVYYSDNDFDKTPWERFVEEFMGGSSGSRFQRPTGIASDGRGRVYVADQLLRNVRIFDFNQRKMHMLTLPTILSKPGGLAVDSQKRLYVVDGGIQKVAVFSPSDEFLFSFGNSDLFVNPAYLAINERLGRIYVSDGRGSKIVVFDMAGTYLFSFGQLGYNPGHFYSPQGLAIDRNNNVYVADMFNARIQVFDAEGAYIRHFGERGDGAGQMELPKDLAFDSEDHLYLVDSRRGALTVFTPEGEPYLYLAGSRSGNPLTFTSPAGIYIDETDRIHVTDMINQRFTIWQYMSPAYRQAHPVNSPGMKGVK